MNVFKVAGLVLAGLLLAPTQAFAANSVLSNIFDGSEESMVPLTDNELCSGGNPVWYQDAGIFQVAAGGTYLVADVYDEYHGVDVMVLIYEGAFDSNDPESNLLPSGAIDFSGYVDLASDVSYRLVVQQWCSNSEGAWAVTFSGPGNVNADSVRMVPAMTEGLFSATDPVASTECGDSQYIETGPVNVAQSGKYYYSDLYWWSDQLADVIQDACVQVYTAPFDPANPNANRVNANELDDDDIPFGFLDDVATIDLNAETDYYFVVQPLGPSVAGEYFFVLAPPAPFRINKALAGAWYYEPTAGQGLVMDVFDNRNTMFVAWFTFDLERPNPDYTAIMGEPGQRWITAQGAFSGNSADLPMFFFGGMVFDSETPEVERLNQTGSLLLEFDSCMSGTASYDLETANTVGVFPIEPLSDNHVELCESFTKVPGMPGPL